MRERPRLMSDERANAIAGAYAREGEPITFPTKMFYLTEPSRGVFIVNFRIGLELQRLEISRDQLANFLVDGAAMALRPSDSRALQTEGDR